MQYFGKIEVEKRPALFRNPQSFVDCLMERSIGIIFLINLESIQHKLSSENSLNIYISSAVFSILMVHHFLHTNPYKMCRFFKGR